MKNKLSIIPRGVAQLHNGESAEPGVAETLINMREREDALEVVGNPQQLDQLTPGDRVLLVDGDRTLIERGGNILYNGNVVFSTTADVITAHMVGVLLVVVTSEGNVLLRRTASGYSQLDVGAAIPQLHLAAVEQQMLSTTIPAFEFAAPYTAWQAPLASDDIVALTKITRDAVVTMQRSSASQGRFTGVMLARYGVRLWDDSYLWLSQPVMLGHSMISSSYRSTATVTTSGNQFTGTESFALTTDSYRLGISMATGVAAEWRDLVKSIDVMISTQAALVDLDSLDYRCATTISSGTRRYLLEVGLRPRTTSAIVQQAMGGNWRVVASTSCLDGSAFTAVNTAMSSQQVLPSVRCDVVDTQLLAPRSLSQQQCAQVLTDCTLHPISTASMEHNGRLFQAPSTFAVANPWHVLPWLDGTISSGSASATVRVTLSTSEGGGVLQTTASCPCSATALNPIIAFPDVRATHIAIALGNKVWECDLEPLESMGMAAYINPSLNANSLSSGSLPSVASTSNLIPSGGMVLVSAVGNPLVTQWQATVSGCAIMAMGAACRPIYSGGFGRYPIYLFTSQGIMALPQSTSGSYGEPRLITEVVLGEGATPVAGGDALWFVSQYGILCTLSGSTLRRCLHGVASRAQLAWNDRERELWIASPDGTVQVLMPSGRTYSRDLTVSNLYNDPQHALAVTASGALLDLSTETTAEKIFSFLSQPFVLSPLMQRKVTRITWNLFAETPPGSGYVELTLRGERGASCHGYIISRVRAAGRIAAPLSRPLFSPPTRTLRLAATGTLSTGALLLPTHLDSK